LVLNYIFVYSAYLMKIFNKIEDNFSLRYWEISQDDDTDGSIRIKWILRSGISFCSLFYSNFLISVSSIYFLNKLYLLSNNPPILILVGTTPVILIRLLVYSDRKLAGEIGRGFKLLMFPLGFSLFFWDILSPLLSKAPSASHFYQPICLFIINNWHTIEAFLVVLFVITTLEPLFYLFDKINKL
jgi:hypothetical protein